MGSKVLKKILYKSEQVAKKKNPKDHVIPPSVLKKTPKTDAMIRAALPSLKRHGAEHLVPWRFKDGNRVNEKLTTIELKKEAYESYCDHLAQGFSRKSWYFFKDGTTITWQTMENYISEDRTGVLDTRHKEAAEAKAAKTWEHFAQQSAKMEVKHDTAALQMYMRARFGWDRPEHQTSDVKAQATVLIEHFKTATPRDQTIDIPNQQIEEKKDGSN